MNKRILLLLSVVLLAVTSFAAKREKLNFNSRWLLQVGDVKGAEAPEYGDASWQRVTLPRAFNESEAFRVAIENLTDTVMWYRKHFTVSDVKNRKYFVEFEGVRFAADFYLNGHKLGISENGVMASGFDLTPFIKEGDNVMAVRVDNSWTYRERSTGSTYQWNHKNFNANYGGIPKNVFLHVCDNVYQTLPLYSSLHTTGVYVYGSDFDVKAKTMTLNVESEVRNDSRSSATYCLHVSVANAEGKTVAEFEGKPFTVGASQTVKAVAAAPMSGMHFWSWGYGYLYTVTTSLKSAAGNLSDEVAVRTGFRKTRFGEGKIWLNDRVLMVHGYAQRTSNEWPAVGMSVPAWLSDYSNDLMVKSGGNLVRWMHVAPWKQDVESCDRVGLIQAMPAGDAEKDIDGRRWEQRVLLMRDAIIYNRNNPSILFYECGNKGVSLEHFLEMKKIRDQYDPNGGRAIGSREMLAVPEAEYGGEMLYVNKSKAHPLWMMEYCRDEGLRKNWDSWSYPYHPEGDGPLYRGKPAPEYNHNMDEFAVQMVRAWYDYYLERPGTGKRVNSGGTKIVFSDTNTHFRGSVSYRTSGVTDAMRIPKDAFFAHQVMWDGWVTPEQDHTYIVGHWNYKSGTVKPVYVVSTGDRVDLLLNGKPVGTAKRDYQYLFTFDSIAWQPGRLEAVSYRDGREVSRYALETAGKPDHIKLTTIQNPEGFKADGADLAMVQVEVVDMQGRRCPLDNRDIRFNMYGEGEWLGGIAVSKTDYDYSKQTLKIDTRTPSDRPLLLDHSGNYINSLVLPVECGVNRILVRSTVNPGDITLCAFADSVKAAVTTLTTQAVDADRYLPQYTLPCRLDRGETPLTPSYKDVRQTIDIRSAVAGSGSETVANSYDDNEASEWKSDGKKENAWITYRLAGKQRVDEIAIKLTGWRNKIYPLQVFAGKKKVWEGLTYPTLGYVHIYIDKPVAASELTVKMVAPSRDSSKFGDVKELAGGKANELDRFISAKGKVELRIVEIDLLKKK